VGAGLEEGSEKKVPDRVNCTFDNRRKGFKAIKANSVWAHGRARSKEKAEHFEPI